MALYLCPFACQISIWGTVSWGKLYSAELLLISAALLSIGLAFAVNAHSGDRIKENRPGLSLKETFNLYVQSVQRSDLKRLFGTVTSDDDFTFLTACGNMIDSRKGYYEFHEKWFEEKDWEMPVELLEVHEGEEIGFTVAMFRYRSRRPEGGWYHLDSYFTLIFRRQDEMWKVVADIGTPIVRYYTDKSDQIRYEPEQNFLLDIVGKRRTVREFRPDPVPEEHIMRILDAARSAPTSGNQQPWKFLVIRDRAKLDALKAEAFNWYIEILENSKTVEKAEIESIKPAIRKRMDSILSAPVHVAVLVDSKSEYPDYNIYDGTLAAGYLMIAARALGYGTGFFTSYFPGDKMKRFFNIPEQYELICFTPIGIPESWPEARPKKRLEDMVAFESL
jgi:nitroreductase/ketosteroid isomerase-like protein